MVSCCCGCAITGKGQLSNQWLAVVVAVLLLATMNSSLAARMIKHLSQILTTLFIGLQNVGSKSRQVSCKCFKLSSHFDKILHTFQKKMMTTVWFILTRKLNFGGRQFAGPALYSGECQNNQTLGAAKTAACHIFHTNPFYRLHRAPQYICSTAIYTTPPSLTALSKTSSGSKTPVIGRTSFVY